MNYKKIFIVSLFLLAIIAMGSVSASEDIADDSVTAIDPADEAIDQAVEQTEPTDEAISESVDDTEIGESTDSNEELSDENDPIYVEIYNGTLDDTRYLVYLSSRNYNVNGTIKVYVDNELKNETSVKNGYMYYRKYDYNTSYCNMYAYDLNIAEAGTYFINVTFTDDSTQTETVLKTGQITVSEFIVEFRDNVDDLDDDLIYICSGTDKTGTINIYVDGKVKANFNLLNGEFIKTWPDGGSYTTKSIDIEPEDLGIVGCGIFNIKVTFKDNSTNNEKTLNEKKATLIIIDIDGVSSVIGANENLDFIVNFPGLNSGNVAIYEYNYSTNTKGKKIGYANISDGKAIIQLSGKSFTQNYTPMIMEYSTPYGEGNRTFSMQVMKNIGDAKASVPSEIKKGNNAVITFNANQTGDLCIIIDGKVMECEDISSFKYIIPDLAVGTHNVRILFYSYDKEEMGPYMPDFNAFYINSFKITVKAPAPAKVATKIVAAKKTFKVKTKTKKYTITLKTKAGKVIKKVKLTLKVGKKTYKATTNTKGKATFKITKLTKKGTYTATIKFAGNKSYKASTKKVKITVKK